MIQWPLNQWRENVLSHLASSAPAGSRIKNATPRTTACAMTSFWNGSKGVLTEPELPEPDPEAAGSPTEEPEDSALVRSSERVPEFPAACCVKGASAAEDPGFVVPNAQMTVCFVTELT